MTAIHVSLEKAQSLGPPPEGNLAVPVFGHGTMTAELYSPDKVDQQTPHSKDEVYFIVCGSGEFFDGEKTVKVKTGAFIFVPAGVEHRFESFTDDFTVWVIFYGAEGGE